MKRLCARILAIPALALIAALCTIAPASAASHSPAAARSLTAASTTAVTPATIARSGTAHVRVTAHVVYRSDPEESVSPRVGCGGANGVIEWSGRNIDSWGDAWDLCGSGTYVQIFLSWYSPTYHNILIATAGPSSTVGFNTGEITNTLNVGKIGIAACEHDDGWNCGATVHV